jgi:acetyltransferase-like isoleucine patch superfamily enzyme
VVLGAGSLLTKNPGPYEIWAGVPAVKIAKRREMDREEIERIVNQKQFRLADLD